MARSKGFALLESVVALGLCVFIGWFSLRELPKLVNHTRLLLSEQFIVLMAENVAQIATQHCQIEPQAYARWLAQLQRVLPNAVVERPNLCTLRLYRSTEASHAIQIYL